MAFFRPADAAVAAAIPGVTDIVFITSGGFKGVYHCTLQGRRQALKLIQLPPTPAGNDDALEKKRVLTARVTREIDLLRRCTCQEIVKLGTLQPTTIAIEGLQTIAYSEEYLDGPTVWQLLRAKGPKPSEEECKLLFLSLLRGVREIWALEHIHRDIKPMNVIRQNDPARMFVLFDLGIAYSRVDTGLTVSGEGPLATYRYLAPEMANPRFRENLDFRCDLYTSALTVYEYAAQVHPIALDSDDQLLSASRAVNQIPKPLNEYRADFSAGFCAIIDQSLKKIPALRPGNLNALIRQIEGMK